MPKTTRNIRLPQNTWVNLSEESGISSGNRVVIENIGVNILRVSVNEVKPSNDTETVMVKSDAYITNVDLTKLSPLNFGIRIRKDTQDKFGIRINDDLTGMVSFDVICSGYIQLG